jgi:hypothetical protein
MRSFVALGIVVVTLLLLAAKVTRHHRRVVPPSEPDQAEATTRPPHDRRPAPPTNRTWSGPTLRELLDRPQAPAVIRGHARGPDGVAITVRASPAGATPARRQDRVRRIRVVDGAFEIPGLVLGRAYDLTFEGLNLRQTTLRSVTAPADDVEASLDPLPILRGAVGFPPGGACAYDQVALRADGTESDDVVALALDATCQFELTVSDGLTRMILVATGNGPRLEMPLAIPPVGDPAPVCLNPPCQADPLAGTARLRIAFLGADHTDLSATLTFAGGDRSSSYTCFTNGEHCELETLPINQLFNLSAEATDCATTTRTITLHAGDNDISLPCEIGLGALGAGVPNEVPAEVDAEIPGEIQVQAEVVVE